MAFPLEIFCCYARKDQQLLNDLKAHLIPLQRQGLIALWADTDINAGSEWEKEIEKHLNTAQIILLLVSPDFMASEYCYSNEMKRSVERHERGEASVIPVILRPVFWQEAPFGKLQALPTNAKPVIDPSWHSPDEAFFDVAQGIHKVIQEIEKLNQIRKISDTSDKLGQVSVTLALTGLTNEVKLPIQQYPYDVALSFAGEDRVYAEALAQALRHLYWYQNPGQGDKIE